MMHSRLVLISLIAVLVAACATTPSDPPALRTTPALATYCLDAQRIVTRTDVPMQLEVHEDFDAFVKSKASIDGPTIHQYNWYAEDGTIRGVSCKMKSADHLNLEFGAGSAGPDGLCHDMNRWVYAQLQEQIPNSSLESVVFDPSESLDTREQANMVGPVWLLPFTVTYMDDADRLHVATKGFVINFNDPRYQKFPPSWRGTHYCHLIAPDYFSALMMGNTDANTVIGRAANRLVVPALAH
jgi:hypothetical protein